MAIQESWRIWSEGVRPSDLEEHDIVSNGSHLQLGSGKTGNYLGRTSMRESWPFTSGEKQQEDGHKSGLIFKEMYR